MSNIFEHHLRQHHHVDPGLNISGNVSFWISLTQQRLQLISQPTTWSFSFESLQSIVSRTQCTSSQCHLLGQSPPIPVLMYVIHTQEHTSFHLAVDATFPSRFLYLPQGTYPKLIQHAHLQPVSCGLKVSTS